MPFYGTIKETAVISYGKTKVSTDDLLVDSLHHSVSTADSELHRLLLDCNATEGKNWQYRFFVDFEGNLKDSAVKNALRGIEAEADRMRILGNY